MESYRYHANPDREAELNKLDGGWFTRVVINGQTLRLRTRGLVIKPMCYFVWGSEVFGL